MSEQSPPFKELLLENKELIYSWDFFFPSIFLIKTPEITSQLKNAYVFCFIFPNWDSNNTMSSTNYSLPIYFVLIKATNSRQAPVTGLLRFLPPLFFHIRWSSRFLLSPVFKLPLLSFRSALQDLVGHSAAAKM